MTVKCFYSGKNFFQFIKMFNTLIQLFFFHTFISVSENTSVHPRRAKRFLKSFIIAACRAADHLDCAQDKEAWTVKTNSDMFQHHEN